jgi:hypothetical protein
MSNSFDYFILFFYHLSMVVCLAEVYEYERILVILIDITLLINIKFAIKYY